MRAEQNVDCVVLFDRGCQQSFVSFPISPSSWIEKAG